MLPIYTFQTDKMNKNIKKSFQFDSPESFAYIDQNSCGSNFSDHSIDSQDTFSDELSFDYDKLDSDFCPKSPKLITQSEQKFYSNDRLIGDMSTYHTLPTLSKSKHQDLASIDAKTLVDLINGKFDELIAKYLILDARYPYEYNGGHIINAQSSFEKEMLVKKLFNEPIACDKGKRVVLIFHCEFSIERGPKLMRDIREMDRLINKHCYPNLYYPEIYLLEGGYKSFYENYQQMCEPKSYMPMLNDSYRNEMKYFRRKSKTWEETKTNSKSKFTTRTKLSF
ncbi:hypothetical protein BpHYR1_047679 [Brachionus plicatilis]|uniref:M-phase inducer phosphatase n=1 Tax=Brachionus plicatilis TaxID=10195 RepID=A0A3M7T397_BRAPC|nr:hypothetical protein BpHYR1_047679 [Brachionus plicatilis]